MTILPVAEYAPDASPIGATHLTVASGVYPRSDGSDGPLRAPGVYGDALPSQVLGAISSRTEDAAGVIAAGTATGLYTLAGGTWFDRTPSPYALADGDHWRMAQFGDQIIAVTPMHAPQAWQIGSGGDFADLSPDAPKGKFVATFEPGFLMIGAYDNGVLSAPNGVWWSALNDATQWPAPGTLAAASVQSDLQQLPNGGYITGLAPAVGGAAGVVFTERAIYRVEYIGPPQVFAFREVDRARGNACPDGIAQVGGMCFFVGEDGFQMFDGTTCTPIGFGKVDRTFLSTVSPGGLNRVSATIDLARKLVIWSWPSGDGPNDRWLLYSWGANRWRYSDDPLIAGGPLLAARTIPTSIDDLDSLYPAGIDSIPISLDSSVFSGGRPVMAGFDTANRLVLYEGATMAARLETAESEPGPARMFVQGLRPLSDAAAMRLSVGVREHLWELPSYTEGTQPTLDGYASQRITGRYVRARMDVPAGADWSYVHGVDLRASAVGIR
ncbi:hypothetical protein [Rhodovarius lipocyclicus]|uniref:hypothetical protein n=1 Tax=Rhodovarius lipocyclicus TaxID=268410 RepID=UPI001359F3D2|nr:hypothetical protein [Rhodovarius lipocyclicus]